ncbi:unnamed protein product [Didymodactylos carnosus]|uniref:Uncharacterized protein n=1 Tax=Didymodactylos carnosus TaxID=1234261 RepID=A0A8S2QBF0_9BILA|nr:unnamed protein product [Didymodactylos carnosus]CAF4093879.1 unnamed protein product [Didymodactylos carnosus]
MYNTKIFFILLCFIQIPLYIQSLDWLIDRITEQTTLTRTEQGTLLLSNSLISREFLVEPDFATINFFDNHTTKSSLLRSVKPEAVITLDGIEYNIGGVLSNIHGAYFNRTAFWNNKTIDSMAFHFVSYEILDIQAPFKYTPKRFAPNTIIWPPKGIHLKVYFAAPWWAPIPHSYVSVSVNYEMYDGIPLLSKWIEVIDKGQKSDIDLSFKSIELFSVNQPWSPYGNNWLYVETDQPSGHGTNVIWNYESIVNSIPGSFPPLLNCTYETDHPIVLALKDSISSFRVHELVIGSSNIERVALSKHRLFRLLAPHTQENPIFFHMINGTSVAFRQAIDQMADVGFEMLIYSFGSGFDMESDNATYIKQIADDISYANSKGIEVGGYDLIALTRQVKIEWMAIDPDTDGPYGGYSCGSTNHSHHRNDSIYRQNLLQGEYYKILRERSVYINQPDYYFYQGGSKTGMGYNEDQYSLPRWMDISVSRQGMFDDLYERIPTTGWMFVPLTVYHGGGDAAQFEPLVEHLTEYEWALAQYLGAGVAACYRGYRLYDSNDTRLLVKKWVDFYKKYRQILISDVIHVRRADMQSVDSFMHVNPYLNDIKGLAMVFNPTSESINTILTLPLYYTGLIDVAHVSEQENEWKTYTLARNYDIYIPVSLQPLGITWFLIK